jgi:hypothetical protein
MCGVPGLVGSVEVADTEVNESDRRCVGCVGQGSRKTGSVGSRGHNLNASSQRAHTPLGEMILLDAQLPISSQ